MIIARLRISTRQSKLKAAMSPNSFLRSERKFGGEQEG